MDTYLWVPHKELEWCLAYFVREEEGEICLVESLEDEQQPTSGEADVAEKTRFRVPKSLTCGLDPTHKMDLANLCQMNNLHEAPLLDILRNRFMRNSIYTYTADVLISVNPYYVIPELYSSPLAYLNLPGDDEDEEMSLQLRKEEHGPEQAPHVYFIANAALRCLVKPTRSQITYRGDSINQSIIVSGESGAG
jgi:myosin V